MSTKVSVKVIIGLVLIGLMGILACREQLMRCFFYLVFSVILSPMLFGLSVVIIVASVLVTKKVSRTNWMAWWFGVIFVVVFLFSLTSARRLQLFCYGVIEVDMTKDHVASVLGEPPDKNLAIWRYDRRGVLKSVEICFDEEQKVKLKNIYRDLADNRKFLPNNEYHMK